MQKVDGALEAVEAVRAQVVRQPRGGFTRNKGHIRRRPVC